MRILKSNKVFKTAEELYESQEFDQVFGAMYSNEKSWKIRTYNKSKFIVGFAIPTNPEENYGMSSDVYRIYETDEGIRFMKKVTASSMLSSRGLSTATFEIDEDTVKVWISNNLKVSKEDRELLKEYSKRPDTLLTSE